jgi:hypothetical protein
LNIPFRKVNITFRWVAILFGATGIAALAVELPEMVSDCFPTIFMNAIGTWALNRTLEISVRPILMTELRRASP